MSLANGLSAFMPSVFSKTGEESNMCGNERKRTVLLGLHLVALADNKFMVNVERDVHNPDFLAFV
jgi:hypothetical protein